MPAEHIQRQIDIDISNVPFFYGESEKDTVTIQVYISRIEQGRTALEWSDANAFVYFKNSLRGKSCNWLNSLINDRDDLDKTWSNFKPLLRKQFGDSANEYVFAQTIGNIHISQFNGDLINYYDEITKAISLHSDKYKNKVYAPADGHGLTLAQLMVVQKAYQDGNKEFHNDLQKEFFIRGLTTKQFDKVKNKRHLNTARDVLDFLCDEETLETKIKANASTSHTAPVVDDDNLAAAGFSNNRSGQRQRRV